MNYICSWLCADERGEESIFPQTGRLSSSQSHQHIYWRCLLVFYITSKRFNKNEKHLLFTNVKQLPEVDGWQMSDVLHELEVEVIFTDFKYKTPKGYYGSFQNQFYEFSILEYIAANDDNDDNHYLILDSDCLFIKPVAELFAAAQPAGFISFADPVTADYVINGLSRNDLKSIYEELLNTRLNEIPDYHLGEFFLGSVKNIRILFNDFKTLWPQLLIRHNDGMKKFNEEAHTLSYLYFKNGFRASDADKYMRRIWTNPLFYREVRLSDVELCIWHLPAEKLFGIYRLYDCFMNRHKNFGFDISHEEFIRTVQKSTGIPYLTTGRKFEYYTISYYRALKKRLQKLSKAVGFFA